MRQMVVIRARRWRKGAGRIPWRRIPVTGVTTRRAPACLMLVVLAASVLVGCMPLGPQARPADKPVDPNPPEKNLTVVLHFPDKTGRWLEMESRPVSGNEGHEVMALSEWLKGPKSPTMGQCLPAGITLSSWR